MNVIITNNKVEYTGFIKARSLKDATELVGTIDFLVYNKSSETRDEKVEYLSKLKDRANTLVYIRDRSKVEQAVQMIVVGSGGKYLDDEFFLENSDELNNLVSSLDRVTEIAEMGGVNVLGDFFNRYLKNGSSGFNSSYLLVVKEAVNTLVEDYKKKDRDLIQLSETATEIFAHSAEVITHIKDEQNKLKEAISDLEMTANSASESTNTPSVMFYPRVSYMKEKNIIRVKDLGRCTYLTSFMLGMRLHLEKIENTRPKLIFIEPVGDLYEKIYKEYHWVTLRSLKNLGNYYNSVVFTNCPTKDVMQKLLGDTDYDIFIVVDRSTSSKDHLLNCKGSSVMYSVNGSSVIKKFNLRESLCFSSLTEIPSTLFTIPLYTEYPFDASQRERLYLRNCSDHYKKLYSLRRR